MDNPQEELVNKTWYVTKLEISGEEYPLPSNESGLQGIFDTYENNDVEFQAEIAYLEACTGWFIFEGEDQFIMNDFACLASDGRVYGPSDLSQFNSLYVWEFWTGGNHPYHFYFSITETDENQQLIVTRDDGDKAYFQNEPYLSVDINSKPSYVLYPNPTTDFVSLSGLDKLTTVKLFTISGKQVLSQTVESSADKIDLTGLSSGVYFYKMTLDISSEIQMGKIIKD